MKVLIAGGRGFLGSVLARQLRSSGHEVLVLTRRKTPSLDQVYWDPAGIGPWTDVLPHVDAVVNACGYGLEHWPWSAARKRLFLSSRVQPGQLLASAISACNPRPKVFIQFSGVNRYGTSGDGVADETSPAGEDFLAQLTVQWEDATASLESHGVRRVVVRNAIVLDASNGLFPLIVLPARMFAGGRLGTGRQIIPWIHVEDHVRAILHLLENQGCEGAYNLVAPQSTTNAEFMAAACAALRRPYWLHMPEPALRVILGEMATLVLEGRASRPLRLVKSGFVFAHPTVDSAIHDLVGKPPQITES